MIRHTILTLTLLLLVMAGCSPAPADERLRRVAEAIADGKDAGRMMMEIDPDRLSEADRHYYDFLTLSWRKNHSQPYDKEGNPRFWHPDSLIPDLLDWYRSRDREIYLQANYLAGEAYANSGDLPTAIDYFHTTLDLLPDDPSSLPMRSALLSRMGRLLNSISLYDEARQYLTQAIEIDRTLADTAELVNNLHTLGGIYLREHDYPEAHDTLVQALRLSAGSSDQDIAKSQMYLAAAFAGQGDTDSALAYIRHVPDRVFKAILPTALGHAADIYLAASLPDTAWLYARRLARHANPVYRAEGYRILLSPQLRSFTPPDTLLTYIADYRDLLESLGDQNGMELAINRQLFYDYRLHERRKEEAERSNATLRQYIVVAIMVIILLALVLLYFKNRNQIHIIELHQALDNIKTLRAELESSRQPESPRPAPAAMPSGEQELREKLRDELMAMYRTAGDNTALSPALLQTDAYRQICALIESDRQIQPPLWKELEQAVLAASPNFRVNLNLLTSGRLTSLDLHTALLIKCGIKPTQMAVLLGRSNGAIVSRRETLSVKIFGEKMGVKVIDAIIRSL